MIHISKECETYKAEYKQVHGRRVARRSAQRHDTESLIRVACRPSTTCNVEGCVLYVAICAVRMPTILMYILAKV